MKYKLLSALMATGTVLGVLCSANQASATTNGSDVSEQEYNQQYSNSGNDEPKLTYDQWQFFNDFVNYERLMINQDDLPEVDLNNLRWESGANDVELFFINEGATYRNQLFYSVDGGNTKEMVFNDVSSPLSILPEEDGSLALGQGVNLGNFAGNTFIEFFIKSNGHNGGRNFFGFDTQQNPDGFNHLLGYELEFGGEKFVMLGFEDIWGGGDQDYNDNVMVVRGLTHTPNLPSNSVSTPEPGTLLGTLFAFGVMGLTSVQKRQGKKSY
ncbi:MAG: DUF4114 domain-containing protein [Moorea sp. SIO3I7]|uniref:DUF4114 domain-containing protein n=1 Tax=Moorena bouillonii PNG TaxID=568701 RepID=A0A1U7NA57_9CYAN|nr:MULTISPECIES: DUF4114 domain-containing protein [Moorena]NEO00029.1 DUF4114 domain-containing protein [Moorena sp. SIO3I7]NEO50141.1 DUF4114 domain-containing protein [Moorena sp. SIO4A3]NEO60935.1 DUF4114 domain-containing protein [Moorena sp. SIO4G2]NEQ82104.1 DUF4114 domain-containing protein [Moorena sp. SIO2I5]NEP29474.1 DUF4114 domain-containing protein [Moorena sp. SIO3I6]